MFKTILVPTGGSVADLPVFEAALTVARLSDAHLVFLHVRVDARDVIASMAAVDFSAGAGMGLWVDEMEADAARQQANSRSSVVEFCGRNKIPMTATPGSVADGVTAEWRTEIGRLADCVSAHARATDLIVAARSPLVGPGEGLLEAALMNGGRPLLIASASASNALKGGLAIAWKDTPEAARAVSAAIPFIRSAPRVLIVSAQEHYGPADKSCDRLSGMLSWHNPNVSVVTLDARNAVPAEILLAEVAKLEIGLLVMGGYGHSRLREAVFGGFTRHLLGQATLPILMAH